MSRQRRRKESEQMGIIGAIALLLLLFVAALFNIDIGEVLESAAEGDLSNQLPGTAPAETVGGDWYEIYFTDPDCPPDAERVGGLDETVAEEIRQATLQVDVATFDLDSEPMITALIDRAAEGVTVRVVVDDDNSPPETTNRLRRNGISVTEDQRSGLMHNKFVIIDGQFLWVGSMNFTSNGAYCNNNNLVRFDAPALAANYQAEMDEMFADREFGPRSPATTPAETLTINGVRVENYFAPETRIAPILADLITAVEEEILFLAYVFTHEDIGEAMFARAEEGVTVRGVFETVGSESSFSYYPDMSEAGLPQLQVRQDGNNRLMHHKVIILDRETVIFGSFNFSGNANDSNDENLLIVHDPTFTSYFVEEFEAVWNEARP